MTISTIEFNHEKFGKCISISNDIIKVDITIDIGPFIIFFGFKDEENILYTLNNKYCEDHSCLGHHLWFSPRTITEPISLNNPVVYTPLSNGVRFTQILEKPINVKIDIETLLSPESNNFIIVHNVQNISKESKKIAINTSTSMNPDGKLIVPQCNDDTGLFPNRLLALWPYSKINDTRFYLGDKYIIFNHDLKTNGPFKFGINDFSGWAAYLINDKIFIKNFIHSEDSRYPNFGCSFESYSDESHLTLDTNSAFYLTKPKDIIKHVENWSIFKDIPNLENHKNDNDIDNFLSKIF